MGRMPNGRALSIEPADSWGPTTSFVIVLLAGCLVTAPWLFAIWRYLAHRSRAMRAESAAKEIRAGRQSTSQVTEGPALLTGKIETDDEGPAIRLEIQQRGREWSNKGNWSHEWKEEGRSVHVRPFRLRLADGTSITVDPDDRVRLVDTLETEKFEATHRRRVSEVSHGERVWVSGVITQEGPAGGKATAYRSGPGGLVLRGSRFDPMEIASGDLETQFSYWRSFYGRAAAVIGVIAVLVHTLLLGHFYAEYWFGRVETASFVRTSTYTTSSKNGRITHHVIHAALPASYGRLPVQDDVSQGDYEVANRGLLPEVPFVVVPAMPSIHSIGVYPDAGILSSIFALIGGILLPLLFAGVRASAMPWYEQKRVTEHGSGQLSSRAWDAQVPGRRGLFAPRPPKI